jgi:hypothetical protein
MSRRRQDVRVRVGWLVAIAVFAGVAWAWQAGHLALPPQHDPWAPLAVAAEPNWLTSFKLRRAKGDATACLAALAPTGVRHEPVPDRVTGPSCGFANAVRVRSGDGVSIGAPLLLSCRAALSYAMWERHALQPAARRELGSPVHAIEHLGSYACRDINTGESPTGRRSKHATADAIDIAGFTTADRQRITVQRDWPRTSSAEARFLRDAHDGACRYFEGALGPDYNAVHADHFHLEVGGWGWCR